MCSKQDMHNKEEEDFTESIGVVSDTLQMLSKKTFTTLEC